MKNILLSFAFFMISLSVHAQDGGGDILDDSLKDVYTVFAVGAGGAILGLSTLSFVEKPSDHLKSIWIGASIGVIIGVGVVAWSQATESQNSYIEGAGAAASLNNSDHSKFGTYARNYWHQMKRSVISSDLKMEMPFFSGTYTF